jgi:hypothetical protein
MQETRESDKRSSADDICYRTDTGELLAVGSGAFPLQSRLRHLTHVAATSRDFGGWDWARMTDPTECDYRMSFAAERKRVRETEK